MKSTLSDAIFGIEPNTSVMHAAVVNYLANQRQGTQSTLTRAEVSGGGRKAMESRRVPAMQDRAPPELHSGHTAVSRWVRSQETTATPCKRRLRDWLLKSALSTKVADSDLIVVDNIAIERVQDQDRCGYAFKALGAEKKALIVMPEVDREADQERSQHPGRQDRAGKHHQCL